jgi:hypothetical protein
MPAKLRVSKMRNPLVTPEAVRLFERGLELQKLGAHEIDWETYEKTLDQEEYEAVERRLHWTLRRLVCDVGPLDIAAGHYADVPDDVEQNGTYRASVPRARELWRLLMKARRSSK